jgi:hypothetical protein
VTKTQLDRWAADYRRKLDHKVRIATIQRESAARIVKMRADDARVRRQREQLSVACIVSIYASETALAKFHRDTNGRIGRPRTVQWAEKELRRLREDDPHVTDPKAGDYRRHVRELCAKGGIEAVFVASIGAWVNGYAWRGLKRIEVPVIRSAWNYASALHELGHVFDPADVGLPRTPARVRAEIFGWTWAIGTALVWDRDMHANMADALPSYRPYGTLAQQAQIDDMTSGLGYRQAQLDRLRRAS